MHVLGAPFSVAAGVLVWGGIAEALHPSGAAKALAAAGLPHRPILVRTLGVLEAVVGAACLLRPTPLTAAAMALIYAGFTVFVASMLVRRVPAGSCGCLGERDLPPTWLHVAFTAIAAVVAGAVGVFSVEVGSILSQAAATPLAGVPYLAGVAAAGVLAALAVVHLPTLATTWRPPRAEPA